MMKYGLMVLSLMSVQAFGAAVTEVGYCGGWCSKPSRATATVAPAPVAASAAKYAEPSSAMHGGGSGALSGGAPAFPVGPGVELQSSETASGNPPAGTTVPPLPPSRRVGDAPCGGAGGDAPASMLYPWEAGLEARRVSEVGEEEPVTDRPLPTRRDCCNIVEKSFYGLPRPGTADGSYGSMGSLIIQPNFIERYVEPFVDLLTSLKQVGVIGVSEDVEPLVSRHANTFGWMTEHNRGVMVSRVVGRFKDLVVGDLVPQDVVDLNTYFSPFVRFIFAICKTQTMPDGSLLDFIDNQTKAILVLDAAHQDKLMGDIVEALHNAVQARKGSEPA